MNDERMEQNFERVFKLLDVISVELAHTRHKVDANGDEIALIREETVHNREATTGLRKDLELGFQRVDRRLGNIELRLETLEDHEDRR